MVKTDLYPDFIYKPLIQGGIEDDYFMEEIDDLTIKVRNLKKKYTNFYKWIAAIDIYNDYMEKLYEKYFSKKILMKSYKAGLVSELVPSKPKLKNKRKNKEFLLLGKMPSIKVFETDLDLEYDFGRDVSGKDINEEDSLKKEKLSKLAKKAMAENERDYRVENIIRTSGFGVTGRDFTYEYMDNLGKGSYNESGKYKERGISDIMAEAELNELKEPWELELEDNKQYKYQNGRFIDMRVQESMDVIKAMYQEGFNVMGALNNNASRSTVKMIKRSTGINEPMTQKEIKKFKKDNKKKQKKLNSIKDNNSVLEEILLKNNFNLGDDEILSMDFTSLSKRKK